MFLTVCGDMTVWSGNFSQADLARIYTNLPYTRTIRCHNGLFEYLNPHKWRSKEEGGGWDEGGEWKEQWIPLSVFIADEVEIPPPSGEPGWGKKQG